MYICQLGDGYMLERDGSKLYKKYTGYPYPDTERPQTELLYDLIYELYCNKNYSLYNYISGGSLGTTYSSAIAEINNCFGSDTEMGVLDLFTENRITFKPVLIGEYNDVLIFKVPRIQKYTEICANVFDSVKKSECIFGFIIVPKDYNLNGTVLEDYNCSNDMDLNICFLNLFYGISDMIFVSDMYYEYMNNILNSGRILQLRHDSLVRMKILRLLSKQELSIYIDSKFLIKEKTWTNIDNLAKVVKYWDIPLNELKEICNDLLVKAFNDYIMGYLILNRKFVPDKNGIFKVRLPRVFKEINDVHEIKLNDGTLPHFLINNLFRKTYKCVDTGYIVLDFKKAMCSEDIDFIFSKLMFCKSMYNDNIDLVSQVETYLGISQTELTRLSFLTNRDFIKTFKNSFKKNYRTYPELLAFLINLQYAYSQFHDNKRSVCTSEIRDFYCEYRGLTLFNDVMNVPEFVKKNEVYFKLYGICKIIHLTKITSVFHTFSFDAGWCVECDENGSVFITHYED